MTAKADSCQGLVGGRKGKGGRGTFKRSGKGRRFQMYLERGDPGSQKAHSE